MSETKLRPCPFCGCPAEFDPLSLGVGVYCTNEDCSVYPETGYYKTQQEAIAAWNTRPLEDELVETLKFVQEHCQLYGAASAARERIDRSINHAEERQ